MKPALKKEKIIHLRCFNGTAHVVELSLKAFPCIFFGFTWMVHDFSTKQFIGLHAVPVDRLLVETDVPYFQFPGRKHTFPVMIGMYAFVESKVRDVS